MLCSTLQKGANVWVLRTGALASAGGPYLGARLFSVFKCVLPEYVVYVVLVVSFIKVIVGNPRRGASREK